MTKLPFGLHCAVGRARSPQAKARRNERDRAMRRENNNVIAEMRATGVLPPAYSKQPPDHVIAEDDPRPPPLDRAAASLRVPLHPLLHTMRTGHALAARCR